jgi:hypothetical protein
MGKISKLFNRFSKLQQSLAETGTNEQNRVDDEHEKEEKKVKESNSSLHEEEVTKKEQKKKSDGKAHIYNLIIVDESGSMSHLREVTLSGINETIGTIRNAQNEFAQTQVHTLTLVTFDTDSNRPAVRTMIDNQPIASVKKFRDYMPNGCTPLYDAMGQSLTRLHTLIKGDVDASAVVTVLTDGLENASREWNAQSLRKLIEQLKQEGWSFSYMGSAHDVKEVTDLLSIENVVEFSHDQLGAGNTWGRERSSRRAYYQKMSDTYSMRETLSDEEIMAEKRRYAKEYYGPRVTPQMIRQLGENEIFVFGSNANGYHRGGAAAFAMREFGAVWGQGEGLQGKSYAVPTTEGMGQLREAVNRFAAFADQHQELRFLVTMIGCGNAGYSPRDIAPLFKGCIDLESVALPIEFWSVLGLKMGF